MKCYRCGSTTQRTKENITQRFGAFVVEIDDAPVDLCPGCGEKYISGPFLLEVEQLVKQRFAKVPHVRVRAQDGRLVVV